MGALGPSVAGAAPPLTGVAPQAGPLWHRRPRIREGAGHHACSALPYGGRMLIWINGPFGGGKTQTAYELRRRLPDSVVCDPELVGFGLQRMSPPELRGDFQDFAAWRQGVTEVLQKTLDAFACPVIVPMTLVEPRYFDEILGRLRHDGYAVHHVALVANRELILERLRERNVGHVLNRWLGASTWVPRRETFAVSNLDRCLERLQDPLFAMQLRTDDLAVPGVAERIATYAGLVLKPRSGGPQRQRLRQLRTSIRHIRWG